MFCYKFDKLQTKFEQVFEISKSFHNKKTHESKLYELSKSVTKTNNKRDALVLLFLSKIQKKQSKSESELYFVNRGNLFIQHLMLPVQTK